MSFVRANWANVLAVPTKRAAVSNRKTTVAVFRAFSVTILALIVFSLMAVKLLPRLFEQE
jgi:hypothetical protein